MYTCSPHHPPLTNKTCAQIKTWSTFSSSQPDANFTRDRDRSGPISDADPINNEILKAIIKLGNTVLSNKAAADLNGLKHRKAPGFQSPAVFHKAMQILSSHHYRLPATRFVIDLFEKGVLRKIVLEEESDDSGSDSD